MPAIPRTPLHFREVFRTMVWGGRKFERLLEKRLPPRERVGESWEVSDHPHGMSVVDEGPLAGLTLASLVARDELGLIGRRGALDVGGRFPLLFKFIDATDTLSLQVHPDDEQASRLDAGDSGKSEAWFVVNAVPGAKIVRGLKPGTTRESLAAAVKTGAVESHLAFVEVKRGDVVSIPPGTVHALGAGLLVAEIQQTSDVSWRLYDWGRVGLDGKPRELHTDRALDVVRFEGEVAAAPLVKAQVISRERPWHERLVAGAKFAFDRYTATESFEVRPAELKSFIILSCTDGEGSLVFDGDETSGRALRRGRTVLLPGAMKTCAIRPSGRLEVLAMSLPPK